MTHLLKGLFIKSKKKMDTAMFHCSDCGNNFKAHRQITREDFDDDDMTITTTYFPMKCPKCENWATTPNAIQCYRVPCARTKAANVTTKKRRAAGLCLEFGLRVWG